MNFKNIDNHIINNPPYLDNFIQFIPDKSPSSKDYESFYDDFLRIIYGITPYCKLSEDKDILLYLYFMNGCIYAISILKSTNQILAYTNAKNFFSQSDIDIDPKLFETTTYDSIEKSYFELSLIKEDMCETFIFN